MIASRTPTKKFAYVNTAIVKCRLHGIYKHYIHARYDKMIETIADTIEVLKYTPEIEMDSTTYKRIVEVLERSRVEFALRNYKDIQRRLRELYYDI